MSAFNPKDGEHPDEPGPERRFDLRLKVYRQFLFVSQRAQRHMEADSNAWMLDAAAAIARGTPPPDHPDPHRLAAGEGEALTRSAGEEALCGAEDAILQGWENGSAEEALFVEWLTDEEQAIAREMRLLVSMKGCAMALTALEALLREFVAEAEIRPETLQGDKKKGERERLVDALIAHGMSQPFTKVQRRELNMIRTARNRYVHDHDLVFLEEDEGAWLEWMPTDQLDGEQVGDIALDIVETCGFSLAEAFRARWPW